MTPLPDPALWKNRDVFVTGHTGFKGSWLCLWLTELGARVHGYALPARADGHAPLFCQAEVERRLASHVEADIRDRSRLARSWQDSGASVLFHLAAQPLVVESYRSPFETFEINTLGAAAVLEAIRTAGRPAALVFVSTDKCYENVDQIWGYRENDRLGGYDPYSASKGAAEIVVAGYRASFFNPANLATHGVRVATARAGNVIGGGDWSANRLIPDMAKALLEGRNPIIRNPASTRPWQHVLEPLSGYIRLAERMIAESGNPVWCSAWNFGPETGDGWSVAKMADAFCRSWGGGAAWRTEAAANPPHEAARLSLCIDKATETLGWRPRWNAAEAVARTAAWYRESARGDFNAAAICLADLRRHGEDV